ncbi:GAF domain-containing protein [Desulfolucanica intricata]|uniref:GAF domain-containing protein n=1 Tax=Desulfolucanica intricata TaxID=1285191 RepID=UPI000836777E|nr:GAF domain-containing protein [Desulfolucanica intricata]
MKHGFPFLEESEKFFRSFVKKYPTIRPVALEVWKSHEEPDIDSNKLYYVFLSKRELKQKKLKNDYLIDAALPYMKYISKVLTGIPHVIALADHEGWILELCGTPVMFGGVGVGIGIGVSWSEKFVGKNGVGTALAKERPVLVYGIEHYDIKYRLSSIGAPIRNNGEIIGCLGISVPVEDAHPARLALALGCVCSLEKDIALKNNQQLGQARIN